MCALRKIEGFSGFEQATSVSASMRASVVASAQRYVPLEQQEADLMQGEHACTSSRLTS